MGRRWVTVTTELGNDLVFANVLFEEKEPPKVISWIADGRPMDLRDLPLELHDKLIDTAKYEYTQRVLNE